MRILVTGSRDWTDRHAIYRVAERKGIPVRRFEEN